MKLYLFENAARVSEHNYHDGGSVAVVASGPAGVEQMIADFPGVILDKEDWEGVRIFDVGPNELPEVFIFPDAGCC